MRTSEWIYARQYFLCEANTKFSVKEKLILKIQRLKKNTFLNKAQQELELLCG
jgi:hypothetical protein